ncbi:SDR family NAD(P)-dependent oxidoreductase [Streptomyces sp. NPDC001276]|uniref:SDR family NAD(P)-dependent oxidoreductase n=1 Tax=Streptomyces sp. NPDC001276 TaxID=3364555 RepID=UPI0036AF320A
MLLRLAYLAATNILPFLRLLTMSDHAKEIEILALRHQLLLLQGQVGKPKFTSTDRAVLAGLLHRVPTEKLRRLLLLVQPETILRWHRDLLRRRTPPRADHVAEDDRSPYGRSWHRTSHRDGCFIRRLTHPGSGHTALGLAMDLRDAESVEAPAHQITEQLGPVDVLVNNAIVACPVPPKLHQAPLELWETDLDVIVKGAVRCTQAVLPSMMERRTSVILNMVSVNAAANGSKIEQTLIKAYAVR